MILQLYDKVINCVFNGYPRSDKGYEPLEVEHEWSKFIINKCITFSEMCKRSNSKDLEMKVLKTMAKKTQFKVEVHVMDTSSSDGIFIVDLQTKWVEVD